MNKRCGFCAKPIEYEKMHVDHIKPILRGVSEKRLAMSPKLAAKKGTNEVSNLLCACSRCNLWKGKHSLEEFRKILAGRIKAQIKSNPTFNLLLDYGFIEITQPPLIQFYFERLQ